MNDIADKIKARESQLPGWSDFHQVMIPLVTGLSDDEIVDLTKFCIVQLGWRLAGFQPDNSQELFEQGMKDALKLLEESIDDS